MSPLVQKMRVWAARQPSDARTPDMLRLAARFEEVITDNTASAAQLLGAWARARKFYCITTGEPLV